jgi:hypothetical protein
MPMSPRLLRPRATNVNVATDADARAYIDAVRAAEGQYMEGGVQRAIDAFIIGCKADSIWTPIKASCILMGARTLSGALVPLVGPAPTNANFVSGDYNRKTGLVGNASNKSLNSNRANNADGQNDNHNAIYVTSIGSVNGQYLATDRDTGAVNQMSGGPSDNLFTRSRAATGNLSASIPSVGLIGISRAVAASYTLRNNASNVTVSVTSQAPVSENNTLYRRGGSSQFFHDCRLSFYSIGESLDLALLDTRVTALYNAIGAAI